MADSGELLTPDQLVAQAQEALQRSEADTAIARLTDALAQNPAHVPALGLLGAAYAAKSQWNEAIQFAVAAVNGNPAHAGLRFNLGAIYQRAGDNDNARGQYEAALQCDPANSRARDALIAMGITPPPPPAAPVSAAPTVTCAEHPTQPVSHFCAGCGKPMCLQCENAAESTYLCNRCYAARYQTTMTRSETEFSTTPAPDFSMSACLSVGWEATMKNLGVGVLTTFVFFVISIVGGSIPLLSYGYQFFVACALQAGFQYVGIRMADAQIRGTKPPEFKDLFAGFECYLPILGAFWIQVPVLLSPFILAGILFPVFARARQMAGGGGGGTGGLEAVVLVFVLAILIVYAYLALRFVFTFPFIVDQRVGAIAGYRLSWHLTQGRALQLFALMIVNGLIVMAGVLMLCVGALFAIPIANASIGAAYCLLTRKSQVVIEAVP